MKVYIGSDHGGYEFKKKYVPWLKEKGYEVVDVGYHTYDPDDDFPDIAFELAEKVVADPGSLGILMCRSGGGMTIAANKVPGARCSTAVSPEEVRHNRNDDDLNILALSGDYVSEELSFEMMEVFLKTPYSELTRFIRRLKKIEEYENKGCGGCCGGCK
ncbi:MAG: Ribose 5-phosphate isomerase [Candidatus Gottesmanbacteria bacterium GW2011_GWC2_39_8]|uniref:Ribose 5-phosphate isomerase n=1 Tax=Candidatus Gottesmanbacteria bacterium GW2011_GWC2_39_8 TaxID=1618450 RepID=A0A0G0SYJ7_9BACT|nr:MAG: Ribose 5-phosphate isomerase [Candidatus Gottesmanbacteria bacterium GW2011_GWC2_39_8]